MRHPLIDTKYRPWVPEIDPKRCSTGNVDTGDCTVCVEYRRLRQESRSQRGLT